MAQWLQQRCIRASITTSNHHTVCKSATRSAATHPSHLVDGGLRVAGGGVAGGHRLINIRLLGLRQQREN